MTGVEVVHVRIPGELQPYFPIIPASAQHCAPSAKYQPFFARQRYVVTCVVELLTSTEAAGQHRRTAAEVARPTGDNGLIEMELNEYRLPAIVSALDRTLSAV